MKNVMRAFARNTVFANILLATILVLGILASRSMIRETLPEFSLDMITISVVYPGADPEEVEEGICQKIEEALEGTEGIKQITTEAHEGLATVLIEVMEKSDVRKVLDDVRTQVNAISTFPVDAEKPVIKEITLKDSVLLLSLSADMPEKRIKEWAERVKDDLQQLEEISQVMVFGTRDYEVFVEVSEEKLQLYGLTFDEVAAAVARSNLNMGGGTIRTKGEEIRLRTMGRKYTGKEISDIVALATEDGSLVTLDQVATIRDDFTEDPLTAFVDGKPAALINILKTKEEDALKIAQATYRYLQDARDTLPQGARLEVVYDSTDMLRARINLLVKNGIIGMIIVFLILYIVLNARLSFWAGMGIPISLAGAMAILWAAGGTVNMVSLFGLILVLGIIVDDAIVVGEAIYVHRKQGKPPLQAAVDGVCEVGVPVIAAVLTTIAAFVPLFYVGGIMGKFIAILPVVVIASLSVSLVECLFMLPAHLSHLPDPNSPPEALNPVVRRLERIHRATSTAMEWFVAHVYTPFLRKALRWRYISLATGIAVLMVTTGLISGGIVKFELFPDLDGFIMTAHVKFPSGTPTEVTREALEQVDRALARLAQKTPTLTGEPMLEKRIMLVGQTLEEIPQTGTNVGSVMAVLLPSERRGVHSKDLMVRWEQETGQIPGVKSIRYTGLQLGPPGDPIEIWIQGHDMHEILAAAEHLKEQLRSFKGVYQIRSDFSPGQNELRLRLKPEARTLQLTVQDLARQVNAAFYGLEALRLQRGRDDVRVKILYTKPERSTLAQLKRMRIRTPTGDLVPLDAVADLEFAPGYATIIRTDGMRRVMVSAGVDTSRANTAEILADLQANYFLDLMDRFPGIRVAVQGEQKKMRESLGTLKIGFPIGLLTIFVIIATVFRSYAQPLVIMFTVPFGIIGAVFGHLIMGYNLSLMSVFGMVSLAGVVVNDAIILIERINENLAEGMDFREAVVQGGGRRFRAIFLTTVSTVGGLAPLIMETDFQARFLIPMALSLAAGVIFATVLTLVLVPSLLIILNDLRRLVFRSMYGTWPSRAQVEPASRRRLDELGPVEGSTVAPAPHTKT